MATNHRPSKPFPKPTDLLTSCPHCRKLVKVDYHPEHDEFFVRTHDNTGHRTCKGSLAVALDFI